MYCKYEKKYYYFYNTYNNAEHCYKWSDSDKRHCN